MPIFNYFLPPSVIDGHDTDPAPNSITSPVLDDVFDDEDDGFHRCVNCGDGCDCGGNDADDCDYCSECDDEKDGAA